jgi:hypothetical protein
MKKNDKDTLVEISAEELEAIVGGHKNKGWKAAPKRPHSPRNSHSNTPG